MNKKIDCYILITIIHNIIIKILKTHQIYIYIYTVHTFYEEEDEAS